MTVFYSWQADLEPRDNRNFIERALTQAAKQASASLQVVSAVVDRDTRGLAGAPDIFNAILTKIEASSAFVADVTPIRRIRTRRGGFKLVTNPNVMMELGFALRALGSERLILVRNVHAAKGELPFDLGQKRALMYDPTTDKDGKELAKALRSALKVILVQQDLAESGTSAAMLQFYFDKYPSPRFSSTSSDAYSRKMLPFLVNASPVWAKQGDALTRSADGDLDVLWDHACKMVIAGIFRIMAHRFRFAWAIVEQIHGASSIISWSEDPTCRGEEVTVTDRDIAGEYANHTPWKFKVPPGECTVSTEAPRERGGERKVMLRAPMYFLEVGVAPSQAGRISSVPGLLRGDGTDRYRSVGVLASVRWTINRGVREPLRGMLRAWVTDVTTQIAQCGASSIQQDVNNEVILNAALRLEQWR